MFCGTPADAIWANIFMPSRPLWPLYWVRIEWNRYKKAPIRPTTHIKLQHLEYLLYNYSQLEKFWNNFAIRWNSFRKALFQISVQIWFPNIFIFIKIRLQDHLITRLLAALLRTINDPIRIYNLFFWQRVLSTNVTFLWDLLLSKILNLLFIHFHIIALNWHYCWICY